jgi:hypothetical protein
MLVTDRSSLTKKVLLRVEPAPHRDEDLVAGADVQLRKPFRGLDAVDDDLGIPDQPDAAQVALVIGAAGKRDDSRQTHGGIDDQEAPSGHLAQDIHPRQQG